MAQRELALGGQPARLLLAAARLDVGQVAFELAEREGVLRSLAGRGDGLIGLLVPMKTPMRDALALLTALQILGRLRARLARR